MKESKNPLLPDFNENWARYTAKVAGVRYWKNSYVRPPEVKGLERVASLIGTREPVFYVLAPHRTQEDYFLPTWTIAKYNLPWARIITGENLDSPLVYAMGFKLPKFGVLWKKRGEMSKSDLQEYIYANVETFKSGLSVAGWPEGADENGARDRSRELRVRDFPPAYFRLPLIAQEKIDKPIKVVCMAVNCIKRPEEEFFERMDSAKKGKSGMWGYHLWGLAAFLNFRYIEKDNPAPRINLSEPINLLDLAGDGNNKKRSIQLANETNKIIKSLLDEIR